MSRPMYDEMHASPDEVRAHYLNYARHEQAAYDMQVSDWERRRYLERG